MTIQHAGYGNAAIEDLVTENTFMQGVLPKYTFAIRTAPTALTLNQKVEYAQRIWAAERPVGTILIPALDSTPAKPKVTPNMDPVMDKLAEEFAKMMAHIANLEKQ